MVLLSLNLSPYWGSQGVWKIKQPKSANLTVVGRGLENFSERPLVITELAGEMFARKSSFISCSFQNFW